MTKWIVAILALILVLAGVVAYGIVFSSRGFSAREAPTPIEEFLATAARQMALPREYRQLHNPYSGPENIEAGMAHFADHCATCHGNNGNGDTLLGKGLYPKPPDMRKTDTQAKSDGELYYVIENGIRLSGMPAFGEHPGTDDAETWHLVTFIRHLPQITPEEIEKMASLNPKTDADREEEQQERDFLNGASPQSEGQSR